MSPLRDGDSVAPASSRVSELAPTELPVLAPEDFRRLAQFIENHLGIRLPPSKRGMLEARLYRRLRKYGFDDFNDYVRLFFDAESHESELQHLVDLATTHHTFFFREDAHFKALTERLAPEILQAHSEIRAWSAGCSTGEEAYSIAITLAEAATTRRFGYHVIGTDVSERVLAEARRAVYGLASLDAVPPHLVRRYFMRAKRQERLEVRVVPELRRCATFEPLNLADSYRLDVSFHLVFLRNVLIYFDRAQARALLARVLEHLVPGGFLVLSHTESAEALGLPLQAIGSSIYRRLA